MKIVSEWLIEGGSAWLPLCDECAKEAMQRTRKSFQCMGDAAEPCDKCGAHATERPKGKDMTPIIGTRKKK